MAINYDLNNTGPEVQERLDQVMPNKTDIEKEVLDRQEADNALQEQITAINNEIGESGQGGETINGRLDTLEAAVGDGGSVDERIAASAAELVGTATEEYDTLGKVEGVIEQNKADQQAVNDDTYRKNETYSQTQIDNMIATDRQQWAVAEATEETTDVTDVLPATGAADTIYRVAFWNGSEYDDTAYSMYAWDGTQYVLLAVRTLDADTAVFNVTEYNAGTTYANATAAANAVPSGYRKPGLLITFQETTTSDWLTYQFTSDDTTNDWLTSSAWSTPLEYQLGVFDISAYHATGGTLATYADLSAALGTNGANVPPAYRKGGMSVKFVSSSDNKYVLYFLNNDEWSSSEVDWEKINLEDEISQLGKNLGKALNKNTYIEYNKAISIDSDIISYVSSNSIDCIWIFIPVNVVKVNIIGASYTGKFLFFNSPVPSTDSYISSNDTGVVPNGAVMCLKNLSHELNPDGYDAAFVTYDYRIDNLPTDGSNNPVKSSGVLASDIRVNIRVSKLLSGDVYIDYNHVVTDGVYAENSNYDCIWLLINKYSKQVSVTGATVGVFNFYSSPYPLNSAFIERTSYGNVSPGAVLCLINAPHESNPGGYDNLVVSQQYNFLIDRVDVDKTAESSAKGFAILKRKVLSIDSVDSIIDSNFADCLLLFIKPFTKTVSFKNVTVGNIWWYNSLEISTAHRIGSTSDGSVPDGSLLGVTNIILSNNNAEYYKTVDIDYVIDISNVTATEVLAKSTNSLCRTHELQLRRQTVGVITPDSVLQGKRVYNGTVENSTYFDVYVYNNIDPSKYYCFSGYMQAAFNLYFISYWDSNDNLIGYDTYRGTGTEDTEFSAAVLSIPGNASTIKMNVAKAYSSKYNVSEIILGDYFNIADINNEVENAPLKVVVKEDKSFYVRHHIDGVNDGILLFDYYKAFAYVRNCIMQKAYYVGAKGETDSEILAKQSYQRCDDSQSPMFTANFGPMFSNHGYSTPVVTIANHGLASSDIGSEWVDQLARHYTIGNIDGNKIYLLPVINETGVPGEETRDWVYYASAAITSITRNVSSGETLQVSATDRWDYQVSSLNNVRVLIDGKNAGEGTYYCKEVMLAYEQIGYNPIPVQQWWPTPVYDGIMLKFDRHFTVSGDKGFLSLTSNTVLNNLYPYPLTHYIDVVPQFPFQIGNYKPHIYIPKMLKHDGDIDFREEFISVDGSHSQVSYNRSTSDLVNVDDMPDRAYCYLMDDEDAVLYGCAGGHSLVRGMSVKSVRNNYIAMNHQVGSWYPAAGNKFYNNILQTTNEEDNILPASFIGEFEGFMCWYKPVNGVQCFYHRTKEGYVVYIHTNQTISKGFVSLPDWMNNMAVDATVEKTSGIELKTNTIVDGKMFFSSDNSIVEYNYVVFLLK